MKVMNNVTTEATMKNIAERGRGEVGGERPGMGRSGAEESWREGGGEFKKNSYMY